MKGHAPTCTGKKTRMTDNVHHPSHYDGPFECLELARLYSFDIGNVIKYVWRWKQKDTPLENLEKALEYLDDAIAHGERMPVHVMDEVGLKYERLQHEPDIGWPRFWMFAQSGMLPEMRKSVQHHINLLEEDNKV